jgi:hypothetical protein
MQIENPNRLLENGISRCDPALRGSGECSQATAVTAGCLRREAGSERDGICFLQPKASGFKPMTTLADRRERTHGDCKFGTVTANQPCRR